MGPWTAQSWGRSCARPGPGSTPGDVGLPAGQRRRVAGLRREEVAQLAHISVDHLTRLEQGRGSGVSEGVLVSLARALQLTDDERTHLFHLAGVSPPQAGRIDGVVRASTMRILERLGDLPVMVLDAKGDVLAWNDLGRRVSWGTSRRGRRRERNIVWQRFLGAERRVSASPEEDDADGSGVRGQPASGGRPLSRRTRVCVDCSTN